MTKDCWLVECLYEGRFVGARWFKTEEEAVRVRLVLGGFGLDTRIFKPEPWPWLARQ